MFRLNKLKSEKSTRRIDFNFSNFQASQVPKGWDKLFVSIFSMERGKTIAKSGKASVRNGNCQWTETLSESIWISQEDAMKELEQYLVKLVVAMGSARSGILGEATVNLACYMSSNASVPISLPLKSCNHGTMLQVKLQCLTPRTKLRDEQLKDYNSFMEDKYSDCDDMENKSDVSDSMFNRSVGSSSSNHLDHSSHIGELGNRDTTFSASGSCHSSDSMEGSSGREVSPRRNLSGIMNNLIGRQDSSGSQNSSLYEPSRSSHSSFNSKVSGSGSHLLSQVDDFGRISHPIATSPLRNAVLTKDLLGAPGMEELRAEARMWEQNARKLMLDLEILRKEFLEQSKNQENLDMDLLASCTECDGLKQEIEQLKILLEESMVTQKATESLKFQAKEIQKELEDELKFQKESNADLAVQLQKTQESNIELVSILQELEDTIEEQKIEIANLSSLKSEFENIEKSSHAHEDNKELDPSEQGLARKMRKASYDSDFEGSTVEHPIRDLHADFDPEDSKNLEFQLLQLLESQKNRETTIQLLEKTLEDKNHEIEIERGLNSQTLLDCEAEWRCKLAAKEEEIINLEAKFSEVHNDQDSKKMGFENGGDCNLIKEIEALKEKVQELEIDCNELTDENLQLLLELKESGKDLQTRGASSNSLSNELKIQEILNEGVATNHLEIQCKVLENKCTDLELQLQAFKDKTCHLDSELHKFQAKSEKQEVLIASLQQQAGSCQGKEAESKDHHAIVCTKFGNSESGAVDSKICSELCEQLQLSLANLKKQRYILFSPENTEDKCGFDNSEIITSTEPITQKEKAEALLKNLVQLNKLLEAKITVCEDEFQYSGEEIRVRATNANEVQSKMKGNDLKENTLCFSCQELESFNMELDCKVTYLSEELFAKNSEMGELKANYLLKEDDIKALRHCQREMEIQISDLGKEKGLVEERMETLLRESTITSKCLENLQNDVMVLRSSVDSQVSGNKILERKSSELETGKCELELLLSELEEENVQLSERISGLEAQLRYLTDERESNRLELQHSESHATSLQEEVRRLETQMEAQKVDMKQKLLDMQKRWSEAQEECEYLKRANPKLQATAESLIEECNLLQKSNGELRKQKMALHEDCTILEAQLRESQKGFSKCSMKIEALEEELSSMMEEISLKEKILNSEVDALLQENKKHKEKLLLEESLLRQMYLEKEVEVENLEREVAHLNEQISASHDERERAASEAVLEVSSLRADNARLEAALQEFQGKFMLAEKKLDTFQMESETKVLGLLGELADSKQNQEVLVADHEKLLGLLESVKSNEQKFKGIVNGLDLKLKASEYERLQLAEEISSLKIQLQKIAVLQDEVLALQSSLIEAKFENESLKASFQLLYGDYEELNAERISFVQKISSTQKTMSDLEDCKRSKVALQEKILRLEGDLTAREALCAQDAELKIELGRIRRTNSQFQRKIKYLEEEKEECLKRAQALEEELKQDKVKQSQSKSATENYPLYPEANSISSSKHQELKFSEVDNEEHRDTGSSQITGVVPVSKIQITGSEISEASEANDMFKAQLKSFSSEGQNDHPDAFKKLTGKDEVIKREGYDQKASILEAELKDISERYFQMSLKYAEVEAQREELVMKLKAVNTGRSWFS
ncbi:hypothetical protein L1049_011056 [Liquidambar formosana]|uniref:C2 NT-type domain-containing protein n=1 Tax=Liquidambar formosana TaxID=63359 RepID=A0AAP0X1N4_LIQFO